MEGKAVKGQYIRLSDTHSHAVVQFNSIYLFFLFAACKKLNYERLVER